jgi:putative PIN family toxin of toxin-antitoxin system
MQVHRLFSCVFLLQAIVNIARPAVLDTNIALDVLLFADPRTDALRQALQTGKLVWLASDAMRHEFERVLGYPALRERVLAYPGGAAALMAAFVEHTQTAQAAPKADYTCKDVDDQIFIDLACQHQAMLLSKDQAVLCMAKRLAKLGVWCCAEWTSA